MASIASGISAWLAGLGAGTTAATVGGYAATAALAAGAIAGVSSALTPDIPDSPDAVSLDKTVDQEFEELKAAELGTSRVKSKQTSKGSFTIDQKPSTTGVQVSNTKSGIQL